MRAQRMDRPTQTAQWRLAVASVAPTPENEWWMRRQLVRRLFALTGYIVPEWAVVVDSAAQWAMAVVDGVMFRLRGNALVVLRPCAHCGTGRFESAPVMNRGDLRYALTVWQPYHHECEPTDQPDDTSW